MSQQTLFIAIGIALVGIFVLTQLVKYPRQILWKLAKSAVLGCLFIFAVNWVGQYFHFHMPFNPYTALTAGFLGVPGVAALVVLKAWVLV